MNSIYEKLFELEKNGVTAVLCTVINSRGSTTRSSGSKMLVYKDGNIFGTVGGGEVEANCVVEAVNIFESNENRILKYQLIDPEKGDPGICGGEIEIFLELVGNSSRIVNIGAGHVGKNISFLAKWAGFNVIIMDDRSELFDSKSFSDVKWLNYSSTEDISSKNIITPETFVILTTRNMNIDISLLPYLIDQNPRYIGVI